MTTDPHAGDELTDDALQGEIELVGDLVVAASGKDGPLTDEEIDAALGIQRPGSPKPEAGESTHGAGGGHDAGEASGQAQGGSRSMAAEDTAHEAAHGQTPADTTNGETNGETHGGTHGAPHGATHGAPRAQHV